MDARRLTEGWNLAFIAALLTLAGALVFLVYATFEAFADEDGGSGGPPLSAQPTATATSGTGSGLPRVFAGEGIGSPSDPRWQVVSNEAAADVAIERTTEGGTVTAADVPVASLYSGVDALTTAQLQAIYAGEVTDWGEVGGQPGPIAVTLVVGQEERLRAYLGLEALGPARLVNSVEELVAALTPDAGAIALVPIQSVTVGVSAIALEGVDPVRNAGDLAAWPFVDRIAVSPLTTAGNDAAVLVREALGLGVPEPITVAATGDILQTRCTLAQIEATGDYGSSLRGEMADYLAAADLALGSLDTSIQSIGEPYRCVEITNLTAPPETIEALTLAGFDGLTVATNHTWDCGQAGFCGPDAFLETLENLRAADIEPVGGGANLEEALAPAIFEVNGVTFGVLGFDDVAAADLEATVDSPGTAPLDDDYSEERAAGEPGNFRPAEELTLNRFAANIRALADEVDVVIVQVQTGIEDTHTPSARTVKALRIAADSGADVIIGNHPHYAGAVEVRGGAFVAYALGNFIFDQVHTPEHTQGYVAEMTFWGSQLKAMRMLPYQIEDQYRPVFAEGELRAKILGDVFTASRELAAGE